MKWLAMLVGMLLGMATSAALVDDTPEDHYLRIYALMQEADALNEAGQLQQALAKYTEAQAALARFPTTYPGWNENIVRFRLNYLNAKLAPLLARFPAQTNALAIPVAPRPEPAGDATPAGDTASLLRELQEEIRRIQTDNQTLQARLREALSVQPAPADPRELARAEEKNRALQKENELLKATLAQEQEKTATWASPQTLEELRKALADSQNRYNEQVNALNALKSENELLKRRAAGGTPAGRADQELQKAQQELAALKTQNSALQESKAALERRVTELEAKALAGERLPTPREARKIDQLQARLERQEAEAKAAARASEERIAQLQKENARLLREKEDLASQLARATQPSKEMRAEAKRIRELEQELEKQTAEARENQARIKTLEKELAALQKTRKDLEASLQKSASDATREEIRKRQQAEAELADLQAKLARTEKLLAKQAESARRSQDTEKELAALQARLRVLESKPTPYAPQELAALRGPELQLVASASEASPGPVATPPAATPAATNSPTPAPPRKAVRQLPPGTGALVAAGQSAFAARRFDEAEQKFLEVLRQDEKNVHVLYNLAAIRIEMNKLDEAQKNLETALAEDNQDDGCLYLLGRVKFLRGQKDEALNLLSRAAQINPENAATQNYLGIVLSEKGLRTQAEAAFRKAIQIQPGYATAHNNLAFIYATQNPPSLALARWHYQKALDAGHPRNSELEKLVTEVK